MGYLMKFKTTIAAFALTASSAFALIGPGTTSKTYCLDQYEGQKGASYTGSCDQTANNKELGKALLENGCAEGQTALQALSFGGKFDIEISSCMPPGVVQL